MKTTSSLFTVLFIGLSLLGCASTPSDSGILEPVEEKREVPTASTEPALVPPVNPALQRVLDLFSTIGYEAVGITYEDEMTLNLLHKVFSDPVAQNRAIQLVYTGYQMAYDPKAQSLTVGGTTDLKTVLKFIKKVPKRPKQIQSPSDPNLTEPLVQ